MSVVTCVPVQPDGSDREWCQHELDILQDFIDLNPNVPGWSEAQPWEICDSCSFHNNHPQIKELKFNFNSFARHIEVIPDSIGDFERGGGIGGDGDLYSSDLRGISIKGGSQSAQRGLLTSLPASMADLNNNLAEAGDYTIFSLYNITVRYAVDFSNQRICPPYPEGWVINDVEQEVFAALCWDHSEWPDCDDSRDNACYACGDEYACNYEPAFDVSEGCIYPLMCCEDLNLNGYCDNPPILVTHEGNVSDNEYGTCDYDDCSEVPGSWTSLTQSESSAIEGCTYVGANNCDDYCNQCGCVGDQGIDCFECVDNGSCAFGDIYSGCLDNTAYNYDSEATYSNQDDCNYFAWIPEGNTNDGDSYSNNFVRFNFNSGYGTMTSDGQYLFRLDLFTLLPYLNKNFEDGFDIDEASSDVFGAFVCFTPSDECHRLRRSDTADSFLGHSGEFDTDRYRTYLSALLYSPGHEYYYKLVLEDGYEIRDYVNRKVFGVGGGKLTVPDVDFFFDYGKGNDPFIQSSWDESDGFYTYDSEKINTYLPIIRHDNIPIRLGGELQSEVHKMDITYAGVSFKNKIPEGIIPGDDSIILSDVVTTVNNLAGTTKNKYEFTTSQGDFSIIGLDDTSFILDPMIYDPSFIRNEIVHKIFHDMGYDVPQSQLVHFYDDFVFGLEEARNISNIASNQTYVSASPDEDCMQIERDMYGDGNFVVSGMSCNSTNSTTCYHHSYRILCTNGEYIEICEAGDGSAHDWWGWTGEEVCEENFGVTPDTYYYQRTYEGVYNLIESDLSFEIVDIILSPEADLNPAAPETILINEFATRGGGSSILDDNDFFELWNNTTESINLNGWSVADGANTADITEDLIISSGGFILFYRDTGLVQGDENLVICELNPGECLQDNATVAFNFGLGGDDSISIINPSAEVQDSHSWSSHPCPSNQSYARIIDGDSEWECRDAETISAGYSNVAGATPGGDTEPTEEINVSSAIDAFILNEVSGKVEAFNEDLENFYDFNNTFRVGEELTLPVCDTYINNQEIESHVSYWAMMQGESTSFPENETWYEFIEMLKENPLLFVDLINRYNELRAPGQALDIERILNKVDDKKEQLEYDFKLDHRRWKLLGQLNMPDFGNIEIPTTYDEEIEYIKRWIEARILWIDHNIINLYKEIDEDCETKTITESFCNDPLASNYNQNSNFNDGHCEYPFDALYTFGVDITSVNFPPVVDVKLKIVNITTEEEKIYDMNKIGNRYVTDVFDLKIGDLFDYSYIKYIDNLSGLLTGSFEEDQPRRFYIYDERRLVFNDIFNNFILELEDSPLPIVTIDTKRNDCQTDEQYYNGDPGFIPGTPATSEEDGLCGFGWYYCPAPYAELELEHFNEIIYAGSYEGSLSGYPDEDSDDIWEDETHYDFYKHRYYESKINCDAICYVECINGEIYQDEPKVTAHMKILYNGEGVNNNIYDEPQSEHKIGIEIRGFSHRGFAKKQYSIELQDGNRPRPQVDDAELGYSLFCNGFKPEPEVDYEDCHFRLEEDFVLLGAYRDKTLMKNAMSYEFWRRMGLDALDEFDRPSISTKYVELVINGVYQGIYVFMERVKIGNNRVNVGGSSLDNQTIIRVESGAEHGAKSIFVSKTDNKTKYEYYDPNYTDVDDLTEDKKEKIINTITHLESLGGGQWEPIANFDELNTYYDVNGFVDYFLIQDFALNREGYSRSQYWYFNLDEYEEDVSYPKVYMGPVWDFNHAYGSFDSEYRGLTVNEYNQIQPDFWKNFYGGIHYLLMIPRWCELRNCGREEYISLVESSNAISEQNLLTTSYNPNDSILDTQNIMSYIDDNYFLFKENKAVERDFLKWYRFGRTYASEIIYFKQWILKRLEEMDTLYLSANNYYWTIYPNNNEEFDVNDTDEIPIVYQSAMTSGPVEIRDSFTKEVIDKFNIDTSDSFSKVYTFDLKNKFGEDLIREYEIEFMGSSVRNNIIKFKITNITLLSGCMDALALNFNVYAQSDDGSCLYRDDIVDESLAESVIQIYPGINSITFPMEYIRLDYNLFSVLNNAYITENCNPRRDNTTCFQDYDTLIVLNGQSDVESNKHITAVFMNGGWITSGDYGIDLDRNLELGDGLLLYVKEKGEIAF